jgi:hypothetical protein
MISARSSQSKHCANLRKVSLSPSSDRKSAIFFKGVRGLWPSRQSTRPMPCPSRLGGPWRALCPRLSRQCMFGRSATRHRPLRLGNSPCHRGPSLGETFPRSTNCRNSRRFLFCANRRAAIDRLLLAQRGRAVYDPLPMLGPLGYIVGIGAIAAVVSDWADKVQQPDRGLGKQGRRCWRWG